MDAPDGGEYSETNRIFMAINQTIHCDSIAHAKTLASPWVNLPEEFQSHVIAKIPMMERTWEELWELQEKFQPHGNGERYRVDSILVKPSASYETITDKVDTAMFKLPTRRSTGSVVILDYYPDEADTALSLPQKLSVPTMAVWKDPAEDAKMDRWMYNAYKEAEQVGRGQYVADFDITQESQRS